MSKSAVCPDCQKVFSHRKNLYQHQRNIHKTPPDLQEYPKNFTCDTCGICFTFVQNLYRHKKKAHNAKLLAGSVKHECTLCSETFRTQHTYLRHLQTSHNEKSETYLFTSKREFEGWKCNEEEKYKALFSARSCYRVFGNARRTVFLCHRYGEFKSRSTGRRCLKVQGSTREGNNCTARMEVTEFQNGEVRVVYFPRHQLHLDSVDYAGRRDKTSSETTIDNSALTEKVSSCRKPRIRLSDIKDVHSLASKMSTDLVVKDRPHKWPNPSVIFVISEKDSKKVYRVSLTGHPCYPGRPNKKCNLICDYCNICIHDYKCSCENWARYGGLMCKHIHLIGISKRRYNTDEKTSDTWEAGLSDIDDSIFVEIEVNGEENYSAHHDTQSLESDTYYDVLDDEIQLSTFESILKMGKNASISELEPRTIQKINVTAQECLNTLQSILKPNNFQDQLSSSQTPLKKVTVESVYEL